MAYGSVLASFNVEDFGTERIRSLTRDEIDERLRDLRRLTHFEVESASHHESGHSSASAAERPRLTT
jgi:hypothetical protein